MKSLIILILCTLFSPVLKTDKEITIDRSEARNAFATLQDIRNHPNNYFQELDFSRNLKTSSIQLRWNDTLAKVAETKAFDMANRNYFGHVDPEGYGINYFINKAGYKLNAEWTSSKSENSFESIAANLFTGKEAIRQLVRDSLTPSLGHRNHLLGLDEWNSTLSDIGIGFIRRDSGSIYQTYVCVIIAKHDW